MSFQKVSNLVCMCLSVIIILVCALVGKLAIVWNFDILADAAEEGNVVEESLLSPFYRIERNLRHALKPTYEVLFERLNTHRGGLKFLSIIRADILSILA